MEPQTKYDPMSEIWKVLIEALRKQAFSVILLLAAVFGLWKMMDTQKDSLDTKISTLEAKVDTMGARYLHCETSRVRLAVKVEMLEKEVDALSRLKAKYQR